MQLDPTYALASLRDIVSHTPGKWPFKPDDVATMLVACVSESPNGAVYWVAQINPTGRLALVRVRSSVLEAPHIFHISVTMYPTRERLLACLDDFVRANGDLKQDADMIHEALAGDTGPTVWERITQGDDVARAYPSGTVMQYMIERAASLPDSEPVRVFDD